MSDTLRDGEILCHLEPMPKSSSLCSDSDLGSFHYNDQRRICIVGEVPSEIENIANGLRIR